MRDGQQGAVSVTKNPLGGAPSQGVEKPVVTGGRHDNQVGIRITGELFDRSDDVVLVILENKVMPLP